MNDYLISKVFKIMGVVLIPLLLTFTVYAIVHDAQKADECAARGGAIVKTSGGYVCAKLEVIKE